MFARRIRPIGILLIIASFYSLTPPLQADSGSFRIDSYIPSRFTDLRWTVGGSTALQSSSYTRDYEDDEGMNRTWSSAQQLMATSSYQRRYITVPKFLTFEMDLQGSYMRVPRGETNHTRYDEIDYDTRFDRNSSDWDISALARPRCDAGIYLRNDLFVSATTYASLSYTDGPTSSAESDFRTHYVHYNDTVEITSGHLESESSGNFRSNSISGELLPGFGRVYEGNYAATSLYIIDELRKLGLLRREPSPEDLRQLTDLVYDFRLRHTPDKRIQQIEALTAITELLRGQGVCDTLGPAGYLAAQDVWYFYPMQSRQFGWRIRSGLGGSYTFRSQNASHSTISHDTTITYWQMDPSDADTAVDYYRASHYNHHSSKTSQLYWLAVGECFRPISMKWQWDAQAQFRIYLKEWSQSDSYRTDYENHTRSSLSTTLSFIPDSRTTATIQLSTSYETYRDREYSTNDDPPGSDEVSFSPDRHSFGVSLSGGLTYRIAIPTSLSASGSWDYAESENLRSADDTRDRRFNLTASINHYIF